MAKAAKKDDGAETLTLGGREVRITNPGKPYFSRQAKLTKLDVVRYYLAVADGALRGIRDRPIVLKRFVDGAEGEAFYQKRAPDKRPEWLRTVTLSFPSGRTAEEVVVDDAAGLACVVNLGCIELHPHAVRAADLDHPDELRVDLDPGPGVGWDDVRRVALEVKALFEELGLRGWPKTSGSRGMHVNVRMQPRWTFTEVRRAALALSREIERRAPTIATSKWWKEERHGVFLDYNQNAKDRTTCSAYSIRPLPDARVSAPLDWGEVPDCDPADFTVATMPARFAARGDPHAGMDAARGRRSRRCWSWRRATRRPGWATRPGRRTFGRRRAKRRAWRRRARGARRASRRCRWSSSPTRPTSRRRWPGSNAGRRSTPRLRRCWPSTTCWSTPCAAARRPGRASASTCATSPRRSARRKRRPTPTTIRPANGAGGGPGRARQGRTIRAADQRNRRATDGWRCGLGRRGGGFGAASADRRTAGRGLTAATGDSGVAPGAPGTPAILEAATEGHT